MTSAVMLMTVKIFLRVVMMTNYEVCQKIVVYHIS